MKIKIREFNIFVDIMLIPSIFITAWCGMFEEYVLAFLATFIHEGAHILIAYLRRGKIYALRLMPFGINAQMDLIKCYGNDKLLIYISGPFVNFFLYITLKLANAYYFNDSYKVSFFIMINLYLAIFNLLPAMPLDGGIIAREILQKSKGIFKAGWLLRLISLSIVYIVLLGQLIYFHFDYKLNISLIAAVVFIFLSVEAGKGEEKLMNIKNIIYRKARLLKKGIYPAREIVVLKNIHLSEIFKSMDFDRFHIVYVLDENLKILKTFTEQEIIDTLLNESTDITFDEMINKL